VYAFDGKGGRTGLASKRVTTCGAGGKLDGGISGSGAPGKGGAKGRGCGTKLGHCRTDMLAGAGVFEMPGVYNKTRRNRNSPPDLTAGRIGRKRRREKGVRRGVSARNEWGVA